MLLNVFTASASETNNSYLVGVNKNINVEKFIKDKGLHLKKHKVIKSGNLLVTQLTAVEIEKLKKDKDIVFIEKDAQIKMVEEINLSQTVPWGFQDIGGVNSFVYDHKGQNIKIALLDTGIVNHPDLTVSGGVHFVDGVSNYTDDNGHGTHIAGIIGAQNNEIGVIGLAPSSAIYSVKVLDSDGLGTYSQAIQGIYWAIDNNMNLISLSFGGVVDSQALHEAIKTATGHGLIVVAASGNGGSGDNTMLYPAMYPEVVSVGAVNEEHQRASFSSTGPGLDIVAPGVDVLSTSSDGSYSVKSGTSMAAPHVTGALAVVWSQNPSWTAQQVIDRIYDTVTQLGDINEYGRGLVDIDRALGIDSTSGQNDSFTGSNIYDEDQKLLVLSKRVEYLIKQARDVNDMLLANKIEQEYNQLLGKSVELHKSINNELNFTKENTETIALALNDSYLLHEAEFQNLESEFTQLIAKYSSPIKNNETGNSLEVLSYNFKGDGQTIQQGDSATVSLQLYSSKSTIVIKVKRASDNTTIESKTFTYNPAKPANSTIAYTWKSSTSTSEGMYYIEYSYPGISTVEYFTIYVRDYITASENEPVDVSSSKQGWYYVFKFTPATSGSYNLFTSPYEGSGSTNDTVLELYSDYNLLKQIDFDDDSGEGDFSKITYNFTGGKTYYIKLYAGWGSNCYVQARLNITGMNNSIITPIYLSKPIDVDLQTSGEYRVYKFIPPSSGNYRIFSGPYGGTGSMNDTYLELYTDINLLNEIKHNDDIDNTGNNYFSEINHYLTGGVAYYIKLRPYDSSGKVHARLTVSPGIEVIGLNSPIDINLPAGAHALYQFTPSSSATYRIRTGFYSGDCNSGDSDTVLTLYKDASLTNRLDCNDDSNGTLFSEIDYFLSAGATYYIKVEEWENSGIYARLKIDIKPTQSVTSITGTDATTAIHSTNSDLKDDWSFQHEPIDLSTGAQVIENTLLNVNGAQNLSFDVRYDSLVLNQGPLGRGWVHNHEKKLKFETNGNVLVYWNSNRINTYTTNDGIRYSSSDLSERNNTLTRSSDGSFTLTCKDQTTYIFNRLGQLTEKRNGHGQSLTLTYDSSERLTTVTEPISGRYLGLHYNSSGLIDRVYDNSNRQVTFTYDINRNLTNITNAGNQSTTYTYDSNGWMLTLTDAEGILVFSNTYDSKGRVIKQIDALDHQATLSYDETSEPGKVITTSTNREGKSQILIHDTNYKLLSIRDELGNLITYTYDQFGNRTSVTDPNNKTSTFTYDSRGNLLTSTDPANHTTTIVYDSRNNLLSVENPTHQKVIYTYDSNNNITSITDQLGNTTINTYNSNGLLVSTKKPGTGLTTYAYVKGQISTVTVDGILKTTMDYDSVGRLISATDNRGKTTATTYDNVDNVTTITNALGNNVRYTYDRNNNKTTETDSKNNTTTFTYNGNLKLTSITDALNNKTIYEYDNEDRLTRVTDQKGNIWSAAYDAKGRVISTSDPLGNTTTFQYDALDRLIGKTDALGNKIETITYDILGNPISSTDVLGSTVYKHYDMLNRLDKITDPLGRITTLNYDNLNRLLSVIDPMGGVSSQGFDVDGNRTKSMDPNNNQILFTYDKQGKLLSQTTVGGNKISYTYDNADLLIKTTNGRGQDTTYQYDDVGRIKSFSDSAGTVTYSYDANGNVTSVTDSLGTITREYDSLNRLIKYTDARGNIIQYNYDQVGNLVSLIYPGGKQVTYGYDKSKRLISVTDWENRTTSYEYDLNGRLIKTIRPDGSILTATYDNAGRVTQQKDVDRNGNIISKYDYNYDAVGNVTSEQSAIAEEEVETPSMDISYESDNRLSDFNGQSVNYDNDGNMISGPLNGSLGSCIFDSRNRLVTTGNTSYQYDAENNRIGILETVNGAVYQTSYIINPNTALSQTLVRIDNSGSQTFYIYGLGLLAQESENNYLTYHFDLRGSTVAVSDVNGQVVERFQYGPYGELVKRTDATNTPFLYNGRDGVMTDHNGLYYMRARYYIPEAKRFVNQDVVLGNVDDGQGLNRYAYVKGDPVSVIDPSGLWGEKVHYEYTKEWAISLGFHPINAEKLAAADNNVDFEDSTKPVKINWGELKLSESNFSWHFDRSQPGGKDTRMVHAEKQMEKALTAMRAGRWDESLTELGRGLHSIQDIEGHMGAGRYEGIEWFHDNVVYSWEYDDIHFEYYYPGKGWKWYKDPSKNARFTNTQYDTNTYLQQFLTELTKHEKESKRQRCKK